LKNRKLALILSFLYCGLGQFYNGHILKGIDFTVLYTLVILGSFFAPAHRLIGIARTAWPFFWVLGMVDAYMSETLYVYVKRDRRKWIIAVLPGVVLSVLVFFIYFKPSLNRLMFWREKVPYNPSSYDSSTSSENSNITVLYSVQVGAFLESGKANKLRDDLLSKGYSVNINRGARRERKWYYVHVGNFETWSEAKACGEKIREQEGHGYILVPRFIDKEEEEKEEKEAKEVDEKNDKLE